VSPVTAALCRALAAEVVFLDVLLRVVPGAAAGAHRDRDEEAGHDRADQHAAERADAGAGPEQVVYAEADHDRDQDREEGRHDHLADRGAGQHVQLGQQRRSG